MFRIQICAAIAACLMVTTGCSIQRKLLDGQVEATRRASGAFDAIGDYELARSAASASLVQFEGFHKLAADNRDALFLLTKSWAGYGTAFPADDWQAAVDADDDELAERQMERATFAFKSAIHYGDELMRMHDNGGAFDAAIRNDDTMRVWLNANFTDRRYTAELFWAAYARLVQIDLHKDDPAMVADLFIPVAMLERVHELDPGFHHFSAAVALAAYHARMPSIEEEMAQSKEMFEWAIAQTKGEALLAKVEYAVKFACKSGNRELYVRHLSEVVEDASDHAELRLENVVAKRRARRYLGDARMKACAFD